MIEIRVTLDASSRLESSIYRLAEALLGAQRQFEPADSQNSDTVSVSVASDPIPTTAPAAPLMPHPGAAPAPAVNTAAPATESNVVPLSGPTYTKDQVAKAGAELIQTNPAKLPELQGLLQQFGVPAVASLQDGQLGAFATALRGLGANI